MTDLLDDRITTALRSLADRPHPPAPTDALIRRGRRARRNRRAAFAGGTAILAAAAVVPLTALPGKGHPSASASPQVNLASAVESTARSTFRVRVAYSFRQGRRYSHETWLGAFDPAHAVGYLRGRIEEPKQLEARFIGSTTYLGMVGNGKWRAIGSGTDPFTVNRGTLGPSRFSTDPVGTLKQLGSIGRLTHVGRSGAATTYTFVYQPLRSGTESPTGARITAVITVADHRIRDIRQSELIPGKAPDIADPNPLQFISDMTFSDYGTPVHVARP